MVEILNDRFGAIDLKEQGFISYNEGNLCFIINSTTSGLKYEISPSKYIFLYYAKSYTTDNYIYSGRSYSHNLEPDISIELFIDDKLVAIIHFDAKYKLDNSITFTIEDLNKMHTYKDAILGTIGSYVLYPGEESLSYIQEEKGQESPDALFPSVGAFHLNINNNSVEKHKILSVLESFINIESQLTMNGIFERNLKSYNYLKRLID